MDTFLANKVLFCCRGKKKQVAILIMGNKKCQAQKYIIYSQEDGLQVSKYQKMSDFHSEFIENSNLEIIYTVHYLPLNNFELDISN